MKNGQVDAADIFTTDPLIKKNEWVVAGGPEEQLRRAERLPLINTAKATDTVKTALNAVSAQLTTQDLIDLLTKVVAGEAGPERRRQGVADVQGPDLT